MTNMDDTTINKLVLLLADEMTKRIYGIHKNQDRNDLTYYADKDEDHMIGELARLMTLLNLYEKCAQVKKHIDKINTILDKL